MLFFKFLISRAFVKNIAFISVFAVVLLTLTYWGLLWVTRHDERIQLPDFSKQSLSRVIHTLTDLNLRYEVIDSLNYYPQYPKRSVIEQNPAPFSFVKRHRKIYFTVNASNYENIAVPSFYGKTFKEVLFSLRALGFELGREVVIPDLGKRVVRRLEHQGDSLYQGAMLPKHSVIDVYYGSGKL